MKHYTQEQIDEARKGNVVEFAQKAGVDLQQTGNSFKGVEHDSLVLEPNKNSWYWNSRDVGGYGALSFAEHYLLADQKLDSKERFKKALKLIAEAKVSQVEVKEIKRDPFKWNPKQVSKYFDQARRYLTKTRKINPLLINSLHKQGVIEQNKFGDALFVWKDPLTHEIKGATQQGTKINHQKFGKRGTLKMIEKNSTTGYGFYFDSLDVTNGKGKPENLRFFESSIDALSFYNLNPKKLKNTRFVSMDGLKENVVANFINLTEHQLVKTGDHVKSVALGVDKDAAGNKFVQKMQKLQVLQKDGPTLDIKSAQPSTRFTGCKDWNDVLKAYSKRQERLRQPVRSQNRQEQARQAYLRGKQMALSR